MKNSYDDPLYLTKYHLVSPTCKLLQEKASQALREKSNAEKRQRASQRESMRSKDGSEVAVLTKKAKTGDMAMTSPLLTTGKLNYIGPSNVATTVVATTAAIDKKDGKEELRTEGLPPNAVDKDGNILVTDWDILAGRGGLTNHHRGNKRFRDIVALHRPDYIRAPKVQKPSVARVIVRAIRNGDPPGRYVWCIVLYYCLTSYILRCFQSIPYLTRRL